jgi:hypothetical protein
MNDGEELTGAMYIVRPCQRCGGKGKIVTGSVDDKNFAWVQCDRCGVAIGGGGREYTPQEATELAIYTWNRM